MDIILSISMFFIGVVAGGIVCWILVQAKIKHAETNARSQANAEMSGLRANIEDREKQIGRLDAEVSAGQERIKSIQTDVQNLQTDNARLNTTIEQERAQAQEKLEVLNDAKRTLSDTFKALSSDALQRNNESFLKLAKSTLEKSQESAKGDLDKRQQAIDALFKPVEKSLKNVDEKLQDIENKRVKAYSGLTEQVKFLFETHKELRTQTSNLVQALRRPEVRGRWGEIQLKRVVEMAGMVDHCDFYEQQSISTENGLLRPDLTVQLPGEKNIIVDSKVPLSAYLEAIEASDEAVHFEKLKEHARHVKTHMKRLGEKSYFSQFEQTPEFVVLFLPGEMFFSAALQQDPSLIETGVAQNVIIATPTTLIALLKAVSYGWTQERLAENAREISDLGRELYTRLSQMGDHLSKVGKNLDGANKAYNSAIGSLENRVLVTARKFDDLHVTVSGKDLKPIAPVEQSPRALQALEFSTEWPGDDDASDST